jgi:exopolysaccharide biosynthesis polyprenyl glycosylphosphotransferase
MIILYIFFVEETIARGWILVTWILIGLFVTGGRFALRRAVQYLRVRGRFLTAVLIVGANEEGQAIAQQLQSNRKAGIWVAAFVDDVFEPGKEPLPGVPILGPTHFLDSMVQYLDIHEIIIASTSVPHDKFIEIFQRFGTQNNVTVRLSSGLYELITTGVEVKEIGNVPLMTVNKMRLTGFETVLKRTLDLLISTTGLLLLWPIMTLIAIAIKWDSPGPIFYRRKVIGAGGNPFYAWKFRTMYTDADERLVNNPELRHQFNQNHKLKNDPRITRIGKFLRRTSLDELPQLFNVFVGQMSLVGPRMITEEERPRYGKFHLNLFTVKPGITGLWQVSGRSDISYEERVMLDMRYIRNYSIWSDLYLLWLTVPAVLKGRGAY